MKRERSAQRQDSAHVQGPSIYDVHTAGGGCVWMGERWRSATCGRPQKKYSPLMSSCPFLMQRSWRFGVRISSLDRLKSANVLAI